MSKLTIISSLTSLAVITALALHFNAFNELKGQVEEQRFGLAVYTPSQGGTGTSTVSSNYLNDCLSVVDDSPLTYSWADCSGAAGSGDPFAWDNYLDGVSTSTALFFLGGASSTDFSATTLAVGGTATATISSAGALTLPTALAVTSGGTGATSLDDIVGTANQLTVTNGADTIIGGDVTLSLPNLVIFPVAASTTRLSVFDTAYFGGSATTTIGSNGLVTLAAAGISLAGSVITDFVGDATIDLVSGALRVVDLICTDCINATEIEDIYLLLAGDSSSGNYTWTGAHDFGGATSIEMVNGSGPTVDAIGEIALDTTENELLIATSTAAGAPAVIKPYEWEGFHFASSSLGSGSTTKSMFLAPPNGAGYTQGMMCAATSTTANLAFVRVVVKDDSNNRTNDFIASSTYGFVPFTRNNGFTALENISVEIGTTTSSGIPGFGLTCYYKQYWTRN